MSILNAHLKRVWEIIGYLARFHFRVWRVLRPEQQAMVIEICKEVRRRPENTLGEAA